MLFWLFLQTALATGVTHTEVPCPLDGAPVRRFHKLSANAQGGYDSDLATYSSRGQYRTHAVSTCPVDLFSVYGRDLSMDIPASVRAPLAAVLANARKRLSNADDPPVWERYAVAADVYRVLGRTALDLARVYLKAAWTARDEAVGIYVGGLEGPVAAQQILSAGRGELAKDLTEKNRKLVLHNLARVAHRAGYPKQRDGYLNDFEATGALDSTQREAIDRFRKMATEIEPHYQRLAVAEFRRALQDETLSDGDQSLARFLLADSLRRLGKDAEALRLYQQVVAQQRAEQQLLDMARFFIAELGG